MLPAHGAPSGDRPNDTPSVLRPFKGFACWMFHLLVLNLHLPFSAWSFTGILVESSINNKRSTPKCKATVHSHVLYFRFNAIWLHLSVWSARAPG